VAAASRHAGCSHANSRGFRILTSIPKTLTDRERELERMIAQDGRELARAETQHDAEGKKFASAIKTLQANIDRHMKERDQIISEINEISMKQYEEDQKTGGIGQTR
jgi:predicted  nucleic acid-binding Zn-ribbon protein